MAEQPALGFGGLLRQLRARAMLTQEELAEAAGLSPRSVSDLERGINRTARKATAELLAGALGLAEPARGLFVAAARGRGPAADVLTALQGQADPLGPASAADHPQTQIVSPPPGFPGPAPASPAADAAPPVTKAASSPAFPVAGQTGARPDAGPAAPPGDGGQRATPPPRDDHPRAAAGAPGPGEQAPRASRPVRAVRLRGFWPFAAAGFIVVVTVAGLAVAWPSLHRADLEGFARFALSMAGIAAGWVAWVRRHRRSEGSGVVSGRELGRLAELLAGAVDAEWTRAAGERGLLEPAPIPVRWQRPAAPFTGPVAAAVASTRFAPLPGLAAAGERRLQAGQVSELYEVYGGLGSGRLVIAGGPGSGKSSAAVLLILAALRHRRSVPAQARPGVPVPVMFTLHGWDPSTHRVRDWMAERLRQTYPLLAGRHGAATCGMLDEGRIAVILDGLDEVPEDLRPAVLRALSQQATFRLVLLTRSAEMAKAAAQALLQGAAAIELQDIDPAAAADYLTRTQLDPPPHGWQELTSRLRQEPGGPLAQALNNPLMLTLVRDTYRVGDDAGELLNLRDAAGHAASAEDIIGHLLDRVLPAAYTQQPGEPPPRYDLPTAERALRCIAMRMNKDGTRDLQWWRVHAWAHAAPRVITTWLAAGLAAGLTAGLTAAPAAGLTAGLVFGIAFGLAGGMVAGAMAWAYAAPRVITTRLAAGLAAGLAAALAFRGGDKIPRRMKPLRWRQLFRRRPLVVGLLAGTVAGVLFGLTSLGTLPAPGEVVVLEDAFGVGLVSGLVAWLGAGLVAGISRPGTDNTSPLSPLSSWRTDRAFGLVGGLVFGLVAGLSFGFLLGLSLPGRPTGPDLPAASVSVSWPALVVGLVLGLVLGLVAGLVYPQSWSSSLAFAQLAVSDRTPVRLMRFLEDARSRSVLRTVGPVYQFRHARLQDRLAAREPATGRAPGEPLPAAGNAATPTAEAPPPSTR